MSTLRHAWIGPADVKDQFRRRILRLGRHWATGRGQNDHPVAFHVECRHVAGAGPVWKDPRRLGFA